LFFHEVVKEESNKVCISKPQTKHNRFYVKAQPLKENLSEAINAGKISAKDEPKVCHKVHA
jgi:elongation factor 2